MRDKGMIGSVLAAMSLMGAAPPAAFSDLATPFERVATASVGQPMTDRVEAVRRTLDALLPGVYPAGEGIDRRIAKALIEFPAKHATYDHVVREFPAALQSATGRFRTTFPGFVSPLPIYLYHSLGSRDGGSDILEPGHRHIMFFGADMIAELHGDDSLQPFMDHELFHLEHARAFADCDQFWCAIWQEGLAVSAAAAMSPHATDHQLLLDTPTPIRPSTDAHWAEALCYISSHFDNTSGTASAGSLMMGGTPPPGLPPRFGYYVGYRIAQATRRSVGSLAALDNETARPIVRAALMRLMVEARSTCATPATSAAITHVSAHPV